MPFIPFFVSAGPTDATVAPAVLATSSAFSAPVVRASADVGTTTRTTVAAVGAPSLSLGASPVLTKLSTVTAIAGPSLSSTAGPATLATSSSVGVPVVGIAAAVAPAGHSSAAAFAAPTLSTGAGPALTTHSSAAAFGVPGVTASAAASVAPPLLSTTSSVGAPAVAAAAAAAPGGLATSSTVGAPAVVSTALVVAGGHATVAAVGAPGVSAGASASVAPPLLATTTSVGVPTVLSVAGAAPVTLATSSAVGVPTISSLATAAVASLATSSAVGAPALAVGADAAAVAHVTASRFRGPDSAVPTVWVTAATTGTSGPLTPTTINMNASGAVYEDLEITNTDQYLSFYGDNVTFRNCRFTNPTGIGFTNAHNLTLEYCEFPFGLGISSSNNVLVDHAKIADFSDGDGIHITADSPGGFANEDIEIRYTYIFNANGGEGAHSDGVQVRGTKRLWFHHNYVDMGDPEFEHNAAFYLQDANGGNHDWKVEFNFFRSNYGHTLYISGAGGMGIFRYNEVWPAALPELSDYRGMDLSSRPRTQYLYAPAPDDVLAYGNVDKDRNPLDVGGSYVAPVAVSTGSTASPATVATASAVGVPSVAGSSSETVSPATLATASAVGAAAVSAGSGASTAPASLATVSLVGAPTVSATSDATTAPASLATTAAVGAAAVSAGDGAVAAPATLTTTASFGAAPLTYIGEGTPAVNTTADTTLLVPYPTGLQQNDVIVLVVGVGAATPPTNPAEFINGVSSASGTGQSPALRISYRQATGAESGSVAVTTPSSTSKGQMFVFRGVSAADPLLAVSSASIGGVSAHTIPGVDVGVAGAALFYFGIANSSVGGSYTPPTVPAAFTELVDNFTAWRSSAGYLVWPGSGATGDINLVTSSNTRGAAGLLVLRPSAAAPSITSSASPAPAGLATTSTVGAPAVSTDVAAAPAGLATATTVGVPTVTTAVAAPTLAAYAFNEGSGTTAAEVNGGTTLTGVPAWDTGRHGSSLRLNLTNGPTLAPYATSGVFTVMFDAFIVGAGTTGYTLFLNDWDYQAVLGNVQVRPDGTFDWYTGTGTTGDYAFPTGQWVNVALLGDGTQRHVYIDGAHLASVNNTALSGNGTLALGGFGGYEPNIKLDNLRFFDRVLSAGEVATFAGTPVEPAGVAGDATVTPTGLATAAAVGAAALSTSSTVQPSTRGTTTSVAGPVVTVSAAALPATHATASTVAAPQVSTGARVAPATVPTAALVGATAVSTGSRPPTATHATVAAVGAPALVRTAVAAPAGLATAAVVGVPTVSSGSGVFLTVTKHATTSAVGAPAVSVGTQAAPSTLATTSTVGAAVARAGVGVTPATKATTTTVGTPVVGSANVVFPSTRATTTTVGAPTVSAGAAAAPARLATSSSVGTPALSTTARVVPAAHATAATVGAPTVSAGTGAAAGPATHQSAVTFGAPTVTVTTVVSPDGVETVAVVGVPVISAGVRVVVGAVVTQSAFGVPYIAATKPVYLDLEASVAAAIDRAASYAVELALEASRAGALELSAGTSLDADAPIPV